LCSSLQKSSRYRLPCLLLLLLLLLLPGPTTGGQFSDSPNSSLQKIGKHDSGLSRV
jgi:hypothetical protein